MVEGAHLLPAIVISPRLKNLISGSGPPFAFVEHVERRRALHLEAVDLPPPVGFAAVRSSRSIVTSKSPVSAWYCTQLCADGRPDEVDAVLVEEEEDRVADHVAVVIAGDELLRLADLEVLERVDAERGESGTTSGPST